ncbi:hypothetical protein NLG97_g5024 [Lecanicillium saksenae]|uniref:Uncharacterized protein n=1 Tax=Lecanicillium saksenae TaxID=468837 RepID=A0ACC1QW70_9HYPO|nr:hypothetical protein NLG97_g5024 [Lecanicillium saksenae]
MKIPFFLFFTAVLLGTAEAGLRHVYENLYAFLAYRFELENVEESKRIIGVKCASAEYATHKCLPGNPKYKRCVGTATVEARGGRMTDACGLREFLSHTSGNKGGHIKGEPYDGEDLHDYRDKAILGAGLENTADFDVNNAARNMYDKKIGGSQIPPWCKVKDGKGAYFPSFERIATRVGDIKAKMSVEDLENNKSKFQRLDACVDGVNVDRRADMSKFLIPELQKAAKGGYYIGFQPYPEARRLFLYAKTLKSIRQSVKGLGDGEESAFRTRKNALDNALARFMRTAEAQKHQAPIEKWDGVKARMLPVKGCARRPANWPADA